MAAAAVLETRLSHQEHAPTTSQERRSIYFNKQGYIAQKSSHSTPPQQPRPKNSSTKSTQQAVEINKNYQIGSVKQVKTRQDRLSRDQVLTPQQRYRRQSKRPPKTTPSSYHHYPTVKTRISWRISSSSSRNVQMTRIKSLAKASHLRPWSTSKESTL